MIDFVGLRFDLIVVVVGTLLISGVLTGVVRRFALRHAPLDVPNERSSYSAPIARGGGIAIVAATSQGSVPPLRVADVAASFTGLQVVCIRSPLVYGLGVRANSLRVDKKRRPPPGAVRNRRSLVSIWNLCGQLVRALEHPLVANRTWLLPVPPVVLRLGAALVGRKAEVARLCGSLVVDVTRIRDELDWSARMSLEEGLARTMNWYLRESKSR